MRLTHITYAIVSFAACQSQARLSGMTTSRIALVTGANQGLGRALVEALAAAMAPQDRVLLTGRDPSRVQAAAAAIANGPAIARVEGRVLDVRDREAIARLAAELGEVDIVFSNATARMSPDADPADEVDAVVETSNLATTGMLRAFAPRLRRGGRLISSPARWARSTRSITGSPAALRRPPRTSTRSTPSSPMAPGRPRRPCRTRRLRNVAEHPVEGRAGRCRPRARPRAPGE